VIAERATRSASAPVRRCACGGIVGPTGECAACRQKRLRREASSGTPQVVKDVLRTAGRPLEPSTKKTMANHFGHDFSRVRVHTDTRAAESVRAVSANAYAVGEHVAFAAGRYAPGTPAGDRLIAHELAHVRQQSAGTSRLEIGPSGTALEREAAAAAADPARARAVRPVTRPLVQRDLATEPPAVPTLGQPDLTEDQINEAIAFNRGRYDETNTRLIQRLLGGPVTGSWTEENIVAIASTQDEYGLKKDGKVGHETFVFLNREQRLEGMSTRTQDCLVSFRLIGPDTATFRRNSPTQCHVGGHFRTEAEFSSRCNCSQFEYRQFIRGHFTRTRGGVTEDIGPWFSRLPAGRINAGFQEDGDTTDDPVHYGHRDDPADDDPIDHYFDAARTDDQAAGCRYENEDAPGGNVDDCRAGDVYDIDVNFRGEIQRNGAPVETKFWTAIRRARWTP
jgi:hypothetical protein